MSKYTTTASNSKDKFIVISGGTKFQKSHTAGKNHGIILIARPNEGDPTKDEFLIYKTGGVTEPWKRELIGTLIEGKFHLSN